MRVRHENDGGNRHALCSWIQLDSGCMESCALEARTLRERWTQRPRATPRPTWTLRRGRPGVRERLLGTSNSVNLLPHLDNSCALSSLVVVFTPPCVEGRPKIVRPLDFATIFAVVTLFLPHLPVKLLFTAAFPSGSSVRPHRHRVGCCWRTAATSAPFLQPAVNQR